MLEYRDRNIEIYLEKDVISKEYTIEKLLDISSGLGECSSSEISYGDRLIIKKSLKAIKNLAKELEKVDFVPEVDLEELEKLNSESLDFDSFIKKKVDHVKVALVDDDKITQKVVQLFLKKEGIEVIPFLDPVEALSKIKSKEVVVDLVLLDLMMPEMTGFEFLQRLRSFDEGETKVIVGSGRQFVQDRLKSLEFGANDFMDKPYNFKELYLRISNLLK